MAVKSSLAERGQLRPTSQPMDTYEQSSAGRGLAQVAHALSQISPEVAQLSDTLFAQRVEEDSAKGKAAADKAYAADVKSEADAMRKGILQPNQSKTFQRSFGKALGQHRALEAGRALAQFAETDLGEETDEKVVHEKLSKFREEAFKGVEGESQDAQASFNAQYLAVESNTLLNLSYRIGQNQKKAFERATGGIISAGIDVEAARQPVQGETLPPLMDRLKGVYASQRQRLYDTGITGERANRIIMDAVTQKAVAEGRPELVDALMVTPNGPGGSASFGTTPELASELRNAYNSARSVRRLADEDEERRKKNEAEGILHKMQDQILEWRRSGRNPQLFDTTEYESQLAGLGHEYAGWARTEAEQMARASTVQKSAVSDEVMIPLIYDRNMTQASLRQMREQGKFGVDEYVKYRELIQRRDETAFTWSKRNNGTESFNQNWVGTVYRWEENEVNKAVDSKYAIVGADITRKFKADATLKLRYQFEDWLYANPNATRDEAKRAINEISKHLVTDMQQAVGGTSHSPASPSAPSGKRADELK